MVPQPRDLTDLVQHVRWFVGRGPRPQFDRYTYWEKFDYWAVFWGMGIIGGSGLLLWFPVFFARFVPGWVFNVALLIHGEEALLAVGFIFTIHFFNGHLRPEKFPMDPVIFTGRITVDELQHERPAEYARDSSRGQPRGAPHRCRRLTGCTRLGRVVGTIAVAVRSVDCRIHLGCCPACDDPTFRFLRDPFSLVGAILATVSGMLFLIVFLLDVFGLHTNPYMGIVFFLVLPGVFVVRPAADSDRRLARAPARTRASRPPRRGRESI